MYGVVVVGSVCAGVVMGAASPEAVMRADSNEPPKVERRRSGSGRALSFGQDENGTGRKSIEQVRRSSWADLLDLDRGEGSLLGHDSHLITTREGLYDSIHEELEPIVEPQIVEVPLLSWPAQRAFPMTYVSRSFDVVNVHKLGPRLESLVRASAADDARFAEFAPKLRFVQEEVPLLGRITPEGVISRTKLSVVMRIREDSGKLIKFQANCDDQNTIHPLLREAIMTRAAAESGVVPRVSFISPPALLDMGTSPGNLIESTLKTNFFLSAKDRLKCITGTRSGTVRSMIVDYTGVSVRSLISSAIPFQLAVTLMIELVTAVQAINNLDIVHGDIHPGNVLITPSGELRIIDLGQAVFESDMVGEPNDGFVRVPTGKFVHCFHSHYNLDGYRYAKRDDLYKAILVGAMAMNGEPYIDFCQVLAGDAANMRKFKAELDMFSFGDEGKRVHVVDTLGLSEEVRTEIKNQLGLILGLIRNVKSVKLEPPYAAVLRALSNIQELDPNPPQLNEILNQ